MLYEVITTCDFTIMGNPDYQAGMTVDMSGFGRFDGRFLIEESTHRYNRSQGYQTSCRGRKVLAW